MITPDGSDRQDREFNFTNSQMADAFKVSASYIRRLKADNPEALLEGVHWLKAENDPQGTTFWSEEGRQAIAALIAGKSSPGDDRDAPSDASNGPVTPSNGPVTEGVTEPESLLLRVARRLAQYQLHQELGPVIAQQRQELLTQLWEEIGDSPEQDAPTWAAAQLRQLQAREMVYVFPGMVA